MRKFLSGLLTNSFQLGTSATSGQVLTTDASGVGTWQAATGGSTYTPPLTKIVASSTASTAEKASANYTCDGTADEVEINLALAAIQAGGGRVILTGGTFNLAATIAFTGSSSFADNPAMYLIGAGADTTILAAASGVHAITITSTPKPGIMRLRINVSGSSDGIRCTAPTTGANDRRGFWMGRFEDIKIQGDFSTHSGWALNLESPFRSTFKRIQALGVKNGIWLKAAYSAFNPGNLTFEDCHMDLAIAGGNAYFLQAPDTGGFFNICTFIECDCIDSSGSATASIGWRFKGSTTTYYTARDLLVLRSNVEQFTTAASFEHAANVEMNMNYVETKTGGTIFSLSSDSVNNQLGAQYIYVPSPKTTTVINDANTDVLKPNTLRNSFARVETGGTLSITKTTATILTALYRDSDGSGVYPTEWQGQTSGLIVKDEGTELFRGTRSINFTGSGVTATNSSGDITVNVPSAASKYIPQVLGTTQGRYYVGGYSSGMPSTNSTVAANIMYALPIFIAQTCTATVIASDIETLVASSNVRLGIYNDNGNGLPGTLLLDAGTHTSASVGTKTIAISQALAVGQYWLVALYSHAPGVKSHNTSGLLPTLGSTTTLNAAATQFGALSMAQTYGTLPASFSTTPTYLSAPPYPLIGLQLT